MKIVFFGTPQFAVPFLEALARCPDFKVLSVVTQPDKPKGRSLKLESTPIAVSAERLGLLVIKLEHLNDNNITIQQYNNADLFIVVAYGVIIPKHILEFPKYGTINLHPSLLPKYRGASPIQAAIVNGDRETGVTLMLLDEELDHGPILWQEIVPIEHHDNTETLSVRLSSIGAQLLLNTIPLYIQGTIQPQPQDHTKATFTKQLTKADGRIDWRKSATDIARMVRAYTTWPGAWTRFEYNDGLVTLKIVKASPIVMTGRDLSLPLGAILQVDNEISVFCGDQTLLRLDTVQPASKKSMSGKEFFNGYSSVKQLQ